MKKSRITLLVLCAAMIFITVGCPQEVDRLKAENRTLSERLEKTEKNLNEVAVERDRLRGDIASVKEELAGKDQEIAAVEQQKKQLEDALRELKALNDKLINRPTFMPGKLPGEVDAALQKFAEENPEIATFDSANGMVKLKSDLTFAPGSASINPDVEAKLKKLVTILNTGEAKKFCVYVAGHTDDMPIGRPDTKRRHPDNWYLSAHRAIGVEKALIASGLMPARIAVIGFSEYHPIEKNKAGKKGNKVNRRVELWIVPPGSFLTEAASK